MSITQLLGSIGVGLIAILSFVISILSKSIKQKNARIKDAENQISKANTILEKATETKLKQEEIKEHEKTTKAEIEEIKETKTKDEIALDDDVMALAGNFYDKLRDRKTDRDSN